MMKKTTKFLKTLAAAAILSAAFSATTFAANGLEMSTKYTGISVKPGDTLSFSLDFTNTTGAGLNTELSATGLPDGWTGYFEGSGKQITSAYVKQNAATVNTSNDPDDGLATYNITVPDTATKGSYNLTLAATDTADASISSNLAVTVNVTDESTGTSQLQTTYAEQEGPTGTTFTFNSTIQNNSSADQTYSLAADVPTGWTATFKPSGQSTQVSSVDVTAKGRRIRDPDHCDLVRRNPQNHVKGDDYRHLQAGRPDRRRNPQLQCKRQQAEGRDDERRERRKH